MNDPHKIYMKTVQDVPAIRSAIASWPTAENMCVRLSELILDIIPDPFGDEASMLHRCFIMASANWNRHNHGVDNEIERLKRFSDGLIRPLNELIDYKVISDKRIIWDPLRETLASFANRNANLRVVRMEHRTDDRFAVNQRFLSLLMASRILSMEDVIAFQALPSRSLLSFS